MALEQKEHTALGKKCAKSTAMVANVVIGVAASYCIATFAYFFVTAQAHQEVNHSLVQNR